MTAAERWRCRAAIARGAGEYVSTFVKLVTGRTPRAAAALSFASLKAPGTRLAVVAEAACDEQRPHVVRHSYRTWAYGYALALIDGKEPLDEELFYVACLLHDHGLERPRAGEDFTLRSAERALQCVRVADRSDQVGQTIADAITMHVTPGLRARPDTVLGCYIQAGSMLDLSGLRANDLSRSYCRAVAAEYQRDGVTDFFVNLVRAEAAANPRSRFGELYRCGITLTFRLNPLRPR